MDARPDTDVPLDIVRHGPLLEALLERPLDRREIEECLGVSRATSHRFTQRLDRLADEPFESVVYDDERPGRPSKLTDEEREQLERAFHHPPSAVGCDAPAWTAALAQSYIEATFDADYCLRQVRELMTDAGLSYTSARPEHQNADERVRNASKASSNKRWMI